MEYLLLIPMVIGGVIGSMITGYIEDIVITPIQEIPNKTINCDNYDNLAWKEACEKTKLNYNKGITLINIVGFISGFGIVGGIIAKLQS